MRTYVQGEHAYTASVFCATAVLSTTDADDDAARFQISIQNCIL